MKDEDNNLRLTASEIIYKLFKNNNLTQLVLLKNYLDGVIDILKSYIRLTEKDEK